MTYLPLLGILLVVAGFALRFNPLLVVFVAAIATGVLGGLSPLDVLGTLGKAFNDNRYVSVVWIVLPVIGLLERYGLQERARTLIGRMHGATTGRLLLAYLVARQALSAVGLTSVAGPAQTVRPLVAPMAEAAAERQHGELEHETREKVRAMSAATDNVGLFFGEDIFVAVGSILLIQGVMQSDGVMLTPLQLSLWAIPPAICAFVIHGFRLLRFDRRLGKRVS
ncbi:DUF969 family protein [Stakelama sediminis]|uniref:Putative membrane protein n=1 Tax=Stakelama sediminis TaxID=463200 RepID=A0A840Z394_9SPHN|nr:DUF969 domain-containing protein [Stakelama sediminis]MBB5720279.1 putative membrane protein [Stakelama sediminis]